MIYTRDSTLRSDRMRISRTVRDEVLKPVDGKHTVPCSECGVESNPDDLRLNHILPRSMGGTSITSNLQALCHSCMGSKRNVRTVSAQVPFSLIERMEQWSDKHLPDASTSALVRTALENLVTDDSLGIDVATLRQLEAKASEHDNLKRRLMAYDKNFGIIAASLGYTKDKDPYNILQTQSKSDKDKLPLGDGSSWG